jgi:hypothetical protein
MAYSLVLLPIGKVGNEGKEKAPCMRGLVSVWPMRVSPCRLPATSGKNNGMLVSGRILGNNAHDELPS